MTFQVNKSPFAGQEGKYLTSRQIRARLQQELLHNVALRVEDSDDADKFRVSGRGELHLSVLIENMRREGYELAVSRPAVIERVVDGVVQEPWEQLTVDFAEQFQGGVMTRLAERKGELISMMPDGRGRVRLEYRIPARGLIGFRTEYLTVTAGTGLLYHIFDGYAPRAKGEIGQRTNGALVSMAQGKAVAYTLFDLQERGSLFIGHGVEVYEGMIIGIHARDNDLMVNPTKGKQLTNVRTQGADEKIILSPPIRFSLEQALEFIDDDELVEVTPAGVRIRKKLLTENERKREGRKAAATAKALRARARGAANHPSHSVATRRRRAFNDRSTRGRRARPRRGPRSRACAGAATSSATSTRTDPRSRPPSCGRRESAGS